MNCYQAQVEHQRQIDALRLELDALRRDVEGNVAEILTLMREVKTLRSVVLEDL